MKKWYDLTLETCKEIVAACKSLPAGFGEERIGKNLPGTRGYMLEVRRGSDMLTVFWSTDKDWRGKRKTCSISRCCIDGVSIQKEFSEAAGVALIKAREGLLKWLRDAAKSYELKEGD